MWRPQRLNSLRLMLEERSTPSVCLPALVASRTVANNERGEDEPHKTADRALVLWEFGNSNGGPTAAPISAGFPPVK